MNEQDSTAYFKNFACLINSLSSFQFVTVGTLVGYILSLGLNINEQNSLGNWLELVGQILLTFNAQEETISSNNDTSNNTTLLCKIQELEEKIRILEKKINN